MYICVDLRRSNIFMFLLARANRNPTETKVKTYMALESGNGKHFNASIV